MRSRGWVKGVSGPSPHGKLHVRNVVTTWTLIKLSRVIHTCRKEGQGTVWSDPHWTEVSEEVGVGYGETPSLRKGGWNTWSVPQEEDEELVRV